MEKESDLSERSSDEIKPKSKSLFMTSGPEIGARIGCLSSIAFVPVLTIIIAVMYFLDDILVDNSVIPYDYAIQYAIATFLLGGCLFYFGGIMEFVLLGTFTGFVLEKLLRRVSHSRVRATLVGIVTGGILVLLINLPFRSTFDSSGATSMRHFLLWFGTPGVISIIACAGVGLEIQRRLIKS